MEAVLCFDDKEKERISNHAYEIHGTEWDPNPARTDSRPGIPISVSTEGMKTVMLEGYMVFLGHLMSNKRSFLIKKFFCYV
jgi:hypothetical protein